MLTELWDSIVEGTYRGPLHANLRGRISSLCLLHHLQLRDSLALFIHMRARRPVFRSRCNNSECCCLGMLDVAGA
jgi:hypothetical protein